MPTARWIGFIVIWFALAALGTDLVRSSRATDGYAKSN
jgi:chloramphenicol-sensitive protein RarD